MIYCVKCTYPAIAVNLTLDSKHVCSGCTVHEEKLKVDWNKREKIFKELLQSYKSNPSNYDCIIPVSGGKDSYFQASYLFLYLYKTFLEIQMMVVFQVYHNNLCHNNSTSFPPHYISVECNTKL